MVRKQNNETLSSAALHQSMKEIPASERPYEKCRQSGPGVLSDAELLAVVLRCGTRRENALALARRILALPGCEGLNGLYHLTQSQLCQVDGVGKVKAAQLACIGELSRRMAKRCTKDGLCFTDPESVTEYYMEDYRHEEREKVLLLMLDTRGRFLGEEVISTGTVNASLISPREVFLTALRHGSVSVILLHNHPSGDPTPSKEDLEMTDRLQECGKLLGIELLDHIIIGDKKSVSFRQSQLI